jgi:hypothetical protein
MKVLLDLLIKELDQVHTLLYFVDREQDLVLQLLVDYDLELKHFKMEFGILQHNQEIPEGIALLPDTVLA